MTLYHRKGLATKDTHAKYQSSTCNTAKVMAKVKVFVTDRRTDRRISRKRGTNIHYQGCVFRADRKNKISWDFFDFSIETAEQNSTKLDRKQNLNVLYQVCVFHGDEYTKLAALADLSKMWHIVLRYTICGPVGLLLIVLYRTLIESQTNSHNRTAWRFCLTGTCTFGPSFLEHSIGCLCTYMTQCSQVLYTSDRKVESKVM